MITKAFQFINKLKCTNHISSNVQTHYPHSWKHQSWEVKFHIPCLIWMESIECRMPHHSHSSVNVKWWKFKGCTKSQKAMKVNFFQKALFTGMSIKRDMHVLLNGPQLLATRGLDNDCACLAEAREDWSKLIWFLGITHHHMQKCFLDKLSFGIS